MSLEWKGTRDWVAESAQAAPVLEVVEEGATDLEAGDRVVNGIRSKVDGVADAVLNENDRIAADNVIIGITVVGVVGGRGEVEHVICLVGIAWQSQVRDLAGLIDQEGGRSLRGNRQVDGRGTGAPGDDNPVFTVDKGDLCRAVLVLIGDVGAVVEVLGCYLEGAVGRSPAMIV